MSEAAAVELLFAALAVAAGAFLGGTLRGILRHSPGGLGGTLAANLSACLVLGLVIGAWPVGGQLWHLALGAGFSGALSTWSTLAAEFGSLLKSRAWRILARYLAATMVGGLMAVWFGWRLAALLG